MDLKLLYFYSPNCGSCKAYETVVDRLSTALEISCQKLNIDVVEPRYKLDGIPTIILTNNDVEIWRSLGNVPYQQVYDDIREYL